MIETVGASAKAGMLGVDAVATRSEMAVSLEVEVATGFMTKDLPTK